jgi:dihydroorotate dehydrogenase (fumarate)
VDKIEVISSHVFSKPEEITLPLRWIGILSGEVDCDMVASTGIHDGQDVIKVLLAGAKAASIATTLYENGIHHIEVMLEQIEQWMKNHHFRSINDFRGRLSQKSTQGSLLYERAQFMRHFSSHSS